jgi:hypothetical protein
MGTATRKHVDGEPIAGADAKGAYYCPGCGIRYDTPGICTGHDEAGHAPIDVEKVTGAKADKADDAGDAKPKTSAKRKTSSTSRSKRKTAGASK